MAEKYKADGTPKLGVAGWFKKELHKARKGKFLLLLMIPGLIYFIIFHYVPIGGLLIAFKDYSSRLGVLQSPWTSNAGLGHFIRFLNTPDVWKYIWNTIALSLLHIIWLQRMACG